MTEDELLAYQGLKKQGAVLLRSSNKKYMVVASTKLPNLTVTLPIRIPVTDYEYKNLKSYIPQYYQGPDSKRKQIEFCIEHSIGANPTGVIIFRRK
jgi:hypothetical protein